MKKIIIALAIVLSVSLTANAQSDGWFKASDGDFNDRTEGTSPGFGLPTEHGSTADAPAPLGEGLLILTAMGAGYAIARRKRD